MIKDLLFKKLSFKYSKIMASLNLKPQELEFGEETKALCLCPHADDESIGMGGLLSIYPKNFDVVLLTDGRKGVKDMPATEVIELRENEFRAAMQIAGVENYTFFRSRDKHLIEDLDTFKKLAISKYNCIFVPNIIDQHPDHKAVSLLLNEILYTNPYRKDLKICFYEVWSALGFVNAYVDISENIQVKKAMISCYQSQTATKDYEYHAIGLNQYRGMLKDKKYVEAFCVMDVEDFKKVCELY